MGVAIKRVVREHYVVPLVEPFVLQERGEFGDCVLVEVEDFQHGQSDNPGQVLNAVEAQIQLDKIDKTSKRVHVG